MKEIKYFLPYYPDIYAVLDEIDRGDGIITKFVADENGYTVLFYDGQKYCSFDCLDLLRKINAYALYLKDGDIEYQYENGEYVLDNREKFEYITRNFLTNSER